MDQAEFLYAKWNEFNAARHDQRKGGLWRRSPPELSVSFLGQIDDACAL